MIPQIIISQELNKQEEYLRRFIADNAVRSYNVYTIKPVKVEITIEQVRSIKQEIITQASETRLFVCYSFDNANLEAQNAFLKTLEEKHIQNYFILFARNAERILPTVRSRSKVQFLDTYQNDPLIRPETEDFLNRVESSASYEFLSDARILNITREDAEIFVDEFLIYLRKKLRENHPKAGQVIRKSLEYKQLLQNNNLNPQLTIDNLLIYFKKHYS